jgi:type IV pilus assembly protein PilB
MDWGVGFIDLQVADVHPDSLRTLPEEYARGRLVIPIEKKDRELRLAMHNPRDKGAIAQIEQMTGLKVVPFLAPEMSIRRAHLLYRGNILDLLERSAVEAAGPATRAGGDRSAAELLSRILEYSVVARASDIHIEPYEVETLVRCRIDGVLKEVLSVAPAAHASLVARVKILSSMRIDERRVPQDGRLELDLAGLRMDIRVSSIPTARGEKLVLRLLSKEAAFVDLEELGLASSDFDTVRANLLRPFGMILITGPTGSGKSTSLYGMLTRLGIERQHALNISTIEDPIEYTMPRVSQMAVNVAAGLEFADGLRALLRQDPDVIMVGEIRDKETADIGVRAALVGRLFLSTLHTNDSTGAVARLLDMGIEPFLLASTLVMVLAQRLVRRICIACRESFEGDATRIAAVRARPDFDRTLGVLRSEGVLGVADDLSGGVRLFRGQGCLRCANSGFRGRVGIFEVFQIDDDIRRMIMERRDGAVIREAAVAAGMKTMFQDGLGKALLGDTTLEEVFRVAL